LDSSDPEVIDSYGNVTQGNEDISVTLIGIFSYQGVNKTVYYFVTVKAIGSTGGYYDSIDDNLIGEALKLALRELITSTHTHNTSYEELKTWLQYTDEDINNPDNIILFYSGLSIDSTWDNDWNREHVWPQSLGWFTESGAGSDLHHIRPTDPSVNSSRGNKKFGEVVNGNEVTISPGNGGGGSGCYSNSQYFEPRDEVKGDVARIIFYLFTRYEESDDFDFTDIAESLILLLTWHQVDPVDEAEMTRNDRIQEYQGNRNPFIDNPEYASLIWS
jgi:endonuclease I